MAKMTVGEARRRCGQKLTIAALGAIEKSEDVRRVIFDASNTVKVNHRIRVQDQVRVPVWQDAARHVEDASNGAGVRLATAFEARRAHRHIPIREEDWGGVPCAPAGRPVHGCLYRPGHHVQQHGRDVWRRLDGKMAAPLG